MKSFTSAIVLSIFVSGCAFSGKPYNEADIDSFKPGETTFDQAKEVLGKPNSTMYWQDGSFTAIWVTSQVILVSAKGKGVGISFDKDGKMKHVVSRSQSGN